jgi:hypothetical protein
MRTLVTVIVALWNFLAVKEIYWNDPPDGVRS